MAFPKIEGYVVTEKLGSGSYSTVYKACTKVGARSIVAIKCVDKSRVKHSGSAIDNLITEIRLLKTLTHPHIVHMKQFTWDDRNIYIIMEYCCGGDLSKYIHRYGRVPEKQVLYFLQQLASALKFLREKGVVHMDLKPHNLLLHKDSNGKYILKVADFGFAQHMAEETKQCVRGSPLYMAPEMLCGEYDARVDLWSVGVIMYECLFGRAPYSSSTFKELVDKIQKQAPIEIPPNSSISPGCLDLLTRLLQHDPNKRISYEEFFSHPYLDLDHMPSKENYEKAVALIKQAIELDSMGHLRRALAAYRDGLLYLVPAVSRETDKLRRAALTGKLTRYMERAEEIKKFLKSQENNISDLPQDPHEDIHRISHDIVVQPPVNNRAVARRVPVCCAGNQSVSSQEFTQYRQADCNPCLCTIQSESVSTANGHRASQPAGSAEVNGVEELPVESGSTSHPEPVSASEPKTKDSSPSRFTFRRFFGRNNTMPYLEAKDSSIIADDSKKQKSEDSSGDVCRIT